ncbi:MAG: DegT/DnrJ/EryC1/StrS family aminotransferase [Actinomycetota bacterium]|nr:DegT/DnrJ/EryC1/StrS family aminotransferase [Actinomycetota bacterium]
MAAFERVLDSGRFVSGAEVDALESALADYTGAGHAVAVGSGTAALTLALMAAGIGPGDEVILPANTFFATAEAVVAAGATPVVADVDPATASIDPRAAADAITSRTAAIIAVHLYGHPADVDGVRALAGGRSLLLLEDAAQAMGAVRAGRRVGAMGDAAAFSFFPTKILGALGEGGAVTTNDAQLAQRVRLLRSHGEPLKNVHETMGFNERMDEVQAAFLSVKLAHLDEDLAQRADVVSEYDRLLGELSAVDTFTVPSGARSVHHLMVVKVPDRDRVLKELHAAGIGAGVHYPTPVHLQPAWPQTASGPGALPHAEALADSVLSLPLYSQMTPNQVERCVSALAEAVAR